MATAKTLGWGHAWELPLAFCILFLFICCCLHSRGVKGSTLPPLSPEAQRGEGPGKYVPPPLPPLLVTLPFPPFPHPGAVYYCERINRETLILPHLLTAHPE